MVIKAQAQKIILNREVTTADGDKLLLGRQSLDKFYTEPYQTWYNEEHDAYVVDQELIKQLRRHKLNTFKIKAFVGTWCEDSHREFPRLVRILESAHYPIKNLEITAVSEKFESPDGQEVLNHISKIPTFIFYKYGREIGRITEAPQSGFLEKDMLDIVTRISKVKVKKEKVKKERIRKTKKNRKNKTSDVE